MPEQTIIIGGKEFQVICQPGEESYLEAAARMLDTEARTLLDQIGRTPTERMLLMSGLMLADKTAAVEDRLAGAENEIEALKAEIDTLRRRAVSPPERVEVPVIPDTLKDALNELAARAEALAAQLESPVPDKR